MCLCCSNWDVKMIAEGRLEDTWEGSNDSTALIVSFSTLSKIKSQELS